MTQVMSILTEKAIRYIPIGAKVEVDIELKKRQSKLIIKVKDNGIGITQGERSKVFEVLQRQQSTRAKRRRIWILVCTLPKRLSKCKSVL